MGERDEATIPVGVVHVESCHTEICQLSQSALGAVFHLGEPRRVDQLNVTKLGSHVSQHIEVFAAQIGASAEMWSRREHLTNHRERVTVFDVDRHGNVVALGEIEQLTERRDVSRKVGAFNFFDAASAQARTDDAVVVEHCDTVTGQPNIRFKTSRPELQGQRKCGQRVLLFVGSCAAVRKQQLRTKHRRQSLLHAATLRADTSAEAEVRASRRLAPVFNLSGTELVFIAVLGLIVLGPEKLPGAMRRAGKIYREIRNISSTVQREVNKVMEEPMRQVKSLVDEPADQLKKSAKDANDIFAGKMPHLEQRPAASAASAYTAAAGSAATTSSASTTSSTSDVPDVATTAVAADGAGPAVNAPSKPGAVPQSEVGGASADQPASGG